MPAIALLLDSHLWIHLTRARLPLPLKSMIAPYVVHPSACLAEPVVFEVLRSATDSESIHLTRLFQSMHLLASPPNLWSLGVELARDCRKAGFNAGAIDLLIGATALHHGAEIITFDADFQKIAAVSSLRVKLLVLPTP